MPEYAYLAADRTGKKIEGKVDVDNEGEVRMYLRGQGLRPVSISKVSMAQVDLGQALKGVMGGNDTVPMDKILNFIRQLHVMISSGVPMIQAIELFYEQETHPVLRRILGNSKEKIKSGSFLWEAFAAYPLVFEKVFVSLIRAGENSGTLEVMLKRIGKYMESTYRLKKLIKGAMVYPISVSVIAVLVVMLMMTMVIPKMAEMVTSNGGELPVLTKFVIDMSHFITGNLLFILGGGALAGYLIRMYARSPEGNVVLQRFQLKLPLFGDLTIKSGVAKFARTLGTLLASGVPIIDSLDICKTASSHIVFEEAITQIKRDVEMGSTIATAMARQQKAFPRMATQMTSVGENTGNMDKMLEKVADFYEEEVEAAIQGMMKMIEPVMLVVLGGIVGVLMIAMYMPIFKMAGSMG